ncbi:MAG: hypothetical protein LBH97_06340 [Treponema sp.]|jgi:hypothetical protein|nr:hypothetical protein [Treponema sp.]
MAFASGVYAQDFGFDDSWGTASAPALSVKISGEIAASLSGYVQDFSSGEEIKAVSLGDIVSGALIFSASAANVNAVIGLNLSAANIGDPAYTPLILDEAYLRAYFGPVNIEAGLRKLSWGKADSLGPLDVINPLDYTDLRNMSDLQAIKIARPLVHATWNMDGFSKLEAVFIPSFTGHRFAQEGRWMPAQYSNIYSSISENIETGIYERLPPQYLPVFDSMYPVIYPQIAASFDSAALFPDTGGLDYFQTGLRFTTTIGPADIGVQYFYGNLFRPDFTGVNVDDFLDDLVLRNLPFILGFDPSNPDFSNLYYGNPNLIPPPIKYNRYHQIGIDYAQVLFDFNIRAEFAVHLTEDMKGDDGTVRNPFIGWSLGFDRNLFWGINANVQCTETIRLLDDKVGNDPLLDCEADTNALSTRMTIRLSKKFLMDELESRATVIWDIENSDCYIIPALVWTAGDLSTELSAGIFTGNESGELGQYWKNSFVKLGLKYTF